MAVSTSTSYPIKITIVDESGLILVDTLVNPCAPITDTCEKHHGIKMEWLSDAPTISEVRMHVLKICFGANFVGHNVRNDLRALGIAAPFVDTGFFEDIEERKKQMPSLKNLASIYLNAEIQTGVHSSVSEFS